MGRVRGLPLTGLSVLLVAVAACRGADSGRPTDVRISGASTLYPILQTAAERLRAERGLRVHVQAGGSTRGFEDTIADRNDLGAMARDLTDDEAAQVRSFPIAEDGVGVVVHRSNPVREVTTEQLRRIYRKEVTNWRQVGGGDAPIVVVTKAQGHATLETFLEHAGLRRSELAVDVVGGDNAQVIRVVANTANAIGYVSLGEVLHAIDHGSPLRLLRLDGVDPTLEAVADHSYPMHRTLFLIAQGDPADGARTVLEFLRSAEGRRIIEQAMYVPVDP